MAGINFNNLPKDLQAKLEPYMTIGGAKSVEEAIAKAKDAKVWTESDEKALSALNGGANWGKTMDELAFNPKHADSYRDNLKNAQKENQLAQARRRVAKQQEPSMAKTVGKYVAYGAAAVGTVAAGAAIVASAPAWVGIAGAAAAIIGLSSCSNKVEVSSSQAVTVNNAVDYNKVINQVLERLDKMDQNNVQGLQAILNQLKLVINAVHESEDSLEGKLDSLYADLIQYLTKIIQNQVEIKTDNNKNAQAILDELTKIKTSNMSCEEKLAAIMALLDSIKSIGESIDNTTKEILEAIKAAKAEIIAALNTNNMEVLAAISKLDENDQNTLNILNDIKELMKTYGNNGKAFAEAILVAIGKIGGSDLSGIEALLKQLVEGQKENNENVKQLIDMFSKFSAGTAEQLNTIIAKLDKSSPDYSRQLNTIIELLKQLDANNDARNKKVLDAIGKLGANMAAYLNAILAKLDKASPDYTAKLDEIIKLLGQLDANNEARNKKILDKIDKLGVDVTFGMSAILDAIKSVPDYNAKLDEIIARMDALNDKTTENGNTLKEILQAIKDHDVKITVDVTGKVTCECNCKCGSHEGILGDLNALLG